MTDAALGSLLVAVLTQGISLAAKAAAKVLPGWVKQFIAAALSLGLISFSTIRLPPLFHNASAQTAAQALIVWALALFAHDAAGAAAKRK